MLFKSSCSGLDFHDSCKLGLPFVSILDQLLLIVEKLFVMEGRVLEVRSLNNGVNGASLLTETTENAFGHVNVVLCGSSAAIGARFGLNLDSKGGASSFAKFASNASFFTCGVPTESMFTTEHG